MTQYVYMNERIKQKRPRKPVIVVQQDVEHGSTTREANCFAIRVGGHTIGHIVYEPEGLEACETHDVKAWVEFRDAVEIVPVASTAPIRGPVAHEKRSGKQVNIQFE